MTPTYKIRFLQIHVYISNQTTLKEIGVKYAEKIMDINRLLIRVVMVILKNC